MKTKTNIDFTFLIFVRTESIERLENCLAVIRFIKRNMPFKIILLEGDIYCNGILQKLLVNEVEYHFIEDPDPIFHLCRYRNDLARIAKSEFVGFWDTDVIVSPDQFYKALDLLATNETDFVYPYEKHFCDTSPIIRKLFIEDESIEILQDNQNRMQELYGPNPVGGAFMANLNAFKEAGMENENFYGWGMEDGERYYRWQKQGCRVSRVPGPLFHLSHSRGINSMFHNEDQGFYKSKETIKFKNQLT